MTKGQGFGPWMLKGLALLGLAALLVVGADRLVGSLRRDVHAVLARSAGDVAPAQGPATPPEPEAEPDADRVAQAEPR
jgi:hypothetical protein